MSDTGRPAVQIAEDIWALEMAMPLGKRTSWCYIIINKDHTLTIIDPGWKMEENLATILGFFEERSIPLTDLAAIFTTHVHPDHFGWHAELSRLSGAEVYAPESEASHFFDKTQSDEFLTQRWRERAVEWGIPEEDLFRIEGGQGEHIEQDRALIHHFIPEGDPLPGADPAWQLLWTPGHTAGMCCVVNHERRIVFSTDHVMAGESPGLGLGGIFVVNPFRLYLSAIKTVRPLDGYLALPGHRQPFTDMDNQATTCVNHHLKRAAEVEWALQGQGKDITLWELAQNIRWSGGFESLDAFRMRSALHHTEIYAEYLLG